MAEALRVPAHLAGRVPASQAASPPSHSTLTGAELPQARKSCIYAGRVASFMSNSLHPCRLWPARLLCQEGSPGKNTGACWPIQVAIPFWSTIFPAALAANPRVPDAARTPATQAAAPPPHLALTGQNQVLQGSLRSKTPVDDPHAEVEIKP